MNHACGNMSIISVIVSLEAPKSSGRSKLARGNNLEIWFYSSLASGYPMPSEAAIQRHCSRMPLLFGGISY